MHGIATDAGTPRAAGPAPAHRTGPLAHGLVGAAAPIVARGRRTLAPQLETRHALVGVWCEIDLGTAKTDADRR